MILWPQYFVEPQYIEGYVKVIVIHFRLKCSIGWHNSKNNISGSSPHANAPAYSIQQFYSAVTHFQLIFGALRSGRRKYFGFGYPNIIG